MILSMASMREYILGAFNARPLGMPIPPNWLGLAAFGVLGFVNPGFWLIGVGAEIAYLVACLGSARFRRVIDGKKLHAEIKDSEQKLRVALEHLAPEDVERFLVLDERCRLAMGERPTVGQEWKQVQGESLAKLRWAYLQLLTMRQAVLRVVENDGAGVSDARGIRAKLAELEARLAEPDLNNEVRKSLQSQREVLTARAAVQKEALDRFEQIEAELGRIEAHVELLREQSLLSQDPDAASARIDSVAESLAGTTRWIQEHQTLYEGLDGSLDEAPPIGARPV
jgi:hypothetical protein